jgi:glycosyltransferase involved in cell wall biosynthesis
LTDELRENIKSRNLENHINFLGLIEDDLAVEQILSKCAVGLAPYLSNQNRHKAFTDVTKPKVYMQCGLPVIITNVPATAKVIDRYKAGVVVSDRKNDFVSAIIKLLTDDKLYLELRSNAIELASKYDWNFIFDHAIQKLIELFSS